MDTQQDKYVKIYVNFDQEGYISDFSHFPSEGYVMGYQKRYENPYVYMDGCHKLNDELIVTLDEEKKRRKRVENADEVNAELDVISERLQHGMENTKVVKRDVESLEEQLAIETFANIEKTKEIQELRSSNEVVQEQLASEMMNTITKEREIETLKKENLMLQEQVALETMNSLELETRVSKIEKQLKGENK